MFRGNGQTPPDMAETRRLQSLRDERAMRSELAEMLAVLVVPALLLSGLDLLLY